jgi:membrane peptidoglycan carboxypeptidase
VMVPHVVKAVVDSKGNVVRTIQPEVKQRVPVEPQFLEAVRQGERKGVVTGSSVATNLHEIKVAGKTGTAEFVETGPDGKVRKDANGHYLSHAWWVGFAPYDNPQIAVAVYIGDAGYSGEGAAFAAPVARKIFARWFHLSDIRNPYGCDTPQSTPGPCANYQSWVKDQFVYTDPVQRESKEEDFHDPSFPMPKDIQASPSVSPSASAVARASVSAKPSPSASRKP